MKSRRSRYMLTLAAFAAAAFVVPSLAMGNLLVNPGFEDNGGSYAGWTTFGSGPQLSLPAGDDIIRTGAAASKIFGEFTGCPATPVFTVGGYFQKFTPAAGQTYTFSGYTWVSSADPMLGTSTCSVNRAIAKIVFFDDPLLGGAAHEICSNEVVIGDGNSALDQWTYFMVDAPAPATAQRVEVLVLFLQPACDTGAVFIDDLAFEGSTAATEPNLLVNPGFSGNLTGWSTFGNVYYDGRTFARRTPTGAAKLFSTFSPDSPSGLFQSFPADAGSNWKFSVYAMTTCQESPITGTNDNFLMARIVFKDALGAELGGMDSVILDSTAPLGTWTPHDVTSVAPALTATVEAYVLFISPTLQGGAAWVDDTNLQQAGYADVPRGAIPAGADLRQNVPNPFNPRTSIEFTLEQAGHVGLAVFDLAGRRIATLFAGTLAAGPHAVTWDGRTDSGVPAAAGSYRYVLQTTSGRVSRSMVLLK